MTHVLSPISISKHVDSFDYHNPNRLLHVFEVHPALLRMSLDNLPSNALRHLPSDAIRDNVEDINLSGLVACGGSHDPAARCPQTADVHLHMQSRLSNCPQHLALPSRRELGTAILGLQ